MQSHQFGRVLDISEIRAEIQKDKKELERITGKKVEFLLIPSGFTVT
jgi:hypothetical protein